LKKSKVFVGTINTANQAKGFAEALRSVGVKADFWSCSNSQHPFGYGTDKVMKFFSDSPPPFKIFGKNIFAILNNYIIKTLYFIKFLFSYNTFIFISPSSILRDNKDLSILRFFKKKIVFVFCGCTERDPDFDKSNPDYICNRCKDVEKQKMCLCDNLNIKMKRVRSFEKYSDYIISQDDSASYLKYKEPIWFYLLSPEPYKDNYLKKYEDKKIRIVHFPSNPLVKQSHIIIPILKKFKDKGKIKIIIKEGIWDKEKIEKELDEAHILVNVLGTGYNKLAVEAMSRGCVVLNSVPEWFKKKVPDAPIYKISAISLESDIKILIKNCNILKEYAQKSIEFYHKFHLPHTAGKYYKEMLNLR